MLDPSVAPYSAAGSVRCCNRIRFADSTAAAHTAGGSKLGSHGFAEDESGSCGTIWSCEENDDW